MIFDQMLTLAILFGTMALFIWGRWRHDLVAMLGLMTAKTWSKTWSDHLHSERSGSRHWCVGLSGAASLYTDLRKTTWSGNADRSGLTKRDVKRRRYRDSMPQHVSSRA